MIDANLASFSSYALAIIAVGAALLVAFGNNFLNVSIALFVEMLALCGIFLALGAQYLGIFTLLLAVFAPILVLAFSSVILGNLQEKTLENSGSSGAKTLRYLGFACGVGIGISVAMVIVDLPSFNNDAASIVEGATTVQLGQALLGGHVIAFELIAITVLSLIIGAGLLLRRAR